jgi:molybdenum cofactor cytidylyltransferase
VKFGEIPVSEARGAIAAHAVRIGGLVLRKGKQITSEDQAALVRAGVERVVAAQLEPDDVHEDAAAAMLAEHLAGPGVRREKPFTGRVNLFASVPGLLKVEVAAIDAINQLDEAITVATLPAYRFVAEGDMAATVKIIPFAASGASLAAARAIENAKGAIDVAQFRPMRVAVVSTLLPGLKPSVVAKTLAVLEARLSPCGASIVEETRVPHETAVLAEAVQAAAARADLVVVFGASAITDRRDVIPSAVERAGGRIEHFGMPVDPGNLLLIGEVAGKPIVGAPGCARSPKENGFDWVLHRLLADVPISRKEIQAMGVGGLLMEIVTRPQPRTGDEG